MAVESPYFSHDEIRPLAEDVRTSDDRVNEHPGDLRYTKPLHEALGRLYSAEWRRIVEDLRTGDQSAVEPAVVFLEVDPRCFRSGYEKERLCRYLARMDLPGEARQRLRIAIDSALKYRTRPERERAAWERLAGALRD